jgi:hypothetical protein
MKQTAVEQLESKILYIIPSSLKNDVIILFNQAKQMEKEQSECICVNVIERILNESEQGREINSKQIFEDVYQLTFKSE